MVSFISALAANNQDRKRPCVLCVAIWLLCLSCWSPALAWETYIGRNLGARVLEIPSSNILRVRADNGDELAIRFYGIGVPTSRQPLGADAHALLNELLPAGKKVVLTTVNEDENGIVNALVQADDHSVNNRLVSDGLAWVDRSTCKAFFCRRWHIEEHLAVKERRGVWALNFSTPPWQWGEVEDKGRD